MGTENTPTGGSPVERGVRPLMLIFACLLFAGCCAAREIAHEPAGRIMDANVIATSFNESMKMQVKTDRFSIVVLGVHSIPLGVEAQIVTMDNGMRYLDYPGASSMPLIL